MPASIFDGSEEGKSRQAKETQSSLVTQTMWDTCYRLRTLEMKRLPNGDSELETQFDLNGEGLV
jgi:hypothetical protein